ncbi:NEDD8-conjugating enzyme Ubc12 [Onychostruthus taczanowskii]|nr:NEDD8-conjugating enzyme Ubc12 [Onychostruthus taczanowskii]
MIKLFSLKQQKKEEESAGGTKSSSKKASAAQLRIQKDINELNLPKTCEIDFSDQDDLLHFRLLICPDEGFYKGGKFVFSFKVGQGYPHDPPKVKCETMVYHPNIDLEGNVCLNILREDWKPVLTINSIIYGLQYLFLEPNPEDPLNKEAAEVLQSNRRLFEQNVQRSLRGGYVGATYFERCLKCPPRDPRESPTQGKKTTTTTKKNYPNKKLRKKKKKKNPDKNIPSIPSFRSQSPPLFPTPPRHQVALLRAEPLWPLLSLLPHRKWPLRPPQSAPLWFAPPLKEAQSRDRNPPGFA